MIDGNGSLEQALPAGSVIARKPGEAPPPGYTLFQRNEYNASLVWKEKVGLSAARQVYDGAVTLNGKIYLAGGYNGTNGYDTFESYDPVPNQWQVLPSMSEARVGPSSAVLNGKIYVIGGHQTNTVEVFDPQSNQWSEGPSLPASIRYGGAIAVDGRLFLMGGMTEANVSTDQVLELDLTSNNWATRESMPTARRGLRLAELDGKVWAIGGYGTTHTDKVEIYDPVSDSWETGTSLSMIRYSPAVWVSAGRIYSGGGSDQTGTIDDSIELFDPLTNQWNIIGDLPQPVRRAASVVLDGKVYVIAGETTGEVNSNKVYAADLPAPAMNLYFKEGNATAEAELSTLGWRMDRSPSGNWHRMLWPRLDWIITRQRRRVACSPSPVATHPPPGYALYKRSDRNGSLVWEEMAPVSVGTICGRWVGGVRRADLFCWGL